MRAPYLKYTLATNKTRGTKWKKKHNVKFHATVSDVFYVQQVVVKALNTPSVKYTVTPCEQHQIDYKKTPCLTQLLYIHNYFVFHYYFLLLLIVIIMIISVDYVKLSQMVNFFLLTFCNHWCHRRHIISTWVAKNVKMNTDFWLQLKCILEPYLWNRGWYSYIIWKSFSEQTSRSRWWTAHLKLRDRLPLIWNWKKKTNFN